MYKKTKVILLRCAYVSLQVDYMMLAVAPTFLLAALVSCSMAYYESPLLEALAVPSADHETTSHLLPRLSAKFRPHGEWESAPDPRFYVLTELERESNQVTAETPTIYYCRIETKWQFFIFYFLGVG
jgi:hypothetical protein